MEQPGRARHVPQQGNGVRADTFEQARPLLEGGSNLLLGDAALDRALDGSMPRCSAAIWMRISPCLPRGTARIKSHEAYVNRAMLTAREALVGMRVRLENEIRGLLKTFGVMFGKRVGGFKRRAEEISEGELAAAPELVPIFGALVQARRDILARIAALDSRIRAVAKRHATVRLLMTAPGVGPITAMAVVAAFDDASRFCRSSSAGAYLGLTPRRYESGEISRNGRVSKRGDGFTRKCLFEAANAIYCRILGGPRLRGWARAIAERTGPRKAKVALARKLAVTLHAMWRTDTPFREDAMA